MWVRRPVRTLAFTVLPKAFFPARKAQSWAYEGAWPARGSVPSVCVSTYASHGLQALGERVPRLATFPSDESTELNHVAGWQAVPPLRSKVVCWMRFVTDGRGNRGEHRSPGQPALPVEASEGLSGQPREQSPAGTWSNPGIRKGFHAFRDYAGQPAQSPAQWRNSDDWSNPKNPRRRRMGIEPTHRGLNPEHWI